MQSADNSELGVVVCRICWINSACVATRLGSTDLSVNTVPMAMDHGVEWKPDEFDVDDVRGMLTQLGELMDQRGEARQERLLPGASEDQIRSTLQTTGLELHPDLIAWFRWTAGPVDEDDWFFMSRKCCRPLQLASVVDVMKEHDGEGVDEPYRQGAWIPFLDYGSMDCTDSDLRGAVLNTWGHYMIDLPYVERLGVLLWWWIAQRVEGVIAHNPDVESGPSFDRRRDDLRSKFVVSRELSNSEAGYDVPNKIGSF